MRTVLVTGGAGFIGCAISAQLADRFDRVIAVDSLHPQVHATRERPADLDPRVELLVGDIVESGMWDDLLATVRPDLVIHLAAETGTGQSLSESTRHAHVNVVGTTQLLDALRRHDAVPQRIVLTGSRAVYGEGAWTRDGEIFYPGLRTHDMLERGVWDFPAADPTAMRADIIHAAPVSVYAATKLAQEQILGVWADAHGVESRILRLQNVYGPGQSLSNPYTGIMSLFCRLARAGESIPLYEDGKVRRDFIIIDDVADAVVRMATTDGTFTDPIDIGSGGYQTIEYAAQLIARHYGAPEPHVTRQFRDGDVRHAWAETSAAAAQLGWTPHVTLEEGVQRLATWIEGVLGDAAS